MKTCTKCGIEKPLDEFHRWSLSKDGYRSQCRACRKIERKEKFRPLSMSKEEYLHLHTLKSLETSETKVCVACLEIQPLRDFSPNKGYRKDVFSRCKSCERVRGTERYSPEDRRKRALKDYGLSITDYETLLNSQKGLCAICASPEGRTGTRLYIDHDHSSGLVRGLLCGNCNSGLGMLGDNLEGVEAAAAYLRKNNG